MRKILIVGLILITSGNVYSGEKEYTVKYCDEGKNNCNECKGTGMTVSFKVSKSIGSVMQTVIKKDGTSKSSVIDNCKIFDEDAFECETINDAYFHQDTASTGTSDRIIFSNGKWEKIIRIGTFRNDREVFREINTYSCGTEIKSVFNFFK
jgi:hypothetical protein